MNDRVIVEELKELMGDDTPVVFVKLTSAYITLEMAVEQAIKVMERSYGAETPHIKEARRMLTESLNKAKIMIGFDS
jgi:hypothetical protein